MKKVQVESSHRILDDFFKVEEALVRFEKFDGHMSPTVRRLNFERGDSAAVMAYNVTRAKLIMVNQFRYPTYAQGPGWVTELIAGMIDIDETPEATVRREIFEEIGYRAGHVEAISTFYVSPGGSSERIFLYYAEFEDSDREGLGGGLMSEAEDILTVELGLDEALRLIKTGCLQDAKTIIGVYWLASRLGTSL